MGWSWGTSTGGAEGKAEDNLIPLSQNLPAAAGNWEALGCRKCGIGSIHGKAHPAIPAGAGSLWKLDVKDH